MTTNHSFRFRDGFMASVREAADREHRSLTNFIVHAVETYIRDHPYEAINLDRFSAHDAAEREPDWDSPMFGGAT